MGSGLLQYLLYLIGIICEYSPQNSKLYRCRPGNCAWKGLGVIPGEGYQSEQKHLNYWQMLQDRVENVDWISLSNCGA